MWGRLVGGWGPNMGKCQNLLRLYPNSAPSVCKNSDWNGDGLHPYQINSLLQILIEVMWLANLSIYCNQICVLYIYLNADALKEKILIYDMQRDAISLHESSNSVLHIMHPILQPSVSRWVTIGHWPTRWSTGFPFCSSGWPTRWWTTGWPFFSSPERFEHTFYPVVLCQSGLLRKFDIRLSS